jgi:putative ABC transport system permease protein
MTTFWQDFRYSIKSMMRSPGFALMTILILALGIGTNGAIFSIVDSVLFRPYPYKDPEQLVMLRMVNDRRGVDDTRVSYPDFVDIRQRNNTFQDLAAADFSRFNLSGEEQPVRVRGARVSPNVFSVAGTQPVVGRMFTEAEGGPGAPKVVVLSDTLWQRSFGGDRSLVGKTIKLDGVPHTLIGIVPSAAQWPDINDAEVFVPFGISPEEADRTDRTHMVLGRMKPGVSVDKAQADLDNLASQVARENPESNKSWGYAAFTLREFRTREDRKLLVFAQTAVIFVLLIACMNVGNLLLQRFTVRQREISLRAALGANRKRLTRQLLTEALPLAILGALAGAVLAQWLLKGIVSMLPADDLPMYLREFHMNTRVLLFLLGISILTVLVFGLAPALRFANPNLTDALSEGGRTAGGRKRQRLRSMIVIAEIGLSLVLLIAAGLMIGSFRQLLMVDPGFNPEGLVAAEISLPETKYAEPYRQVQFYQQLVERAESIPGVSHAAAGTQLPFGGWGGFYLTLEGQSPEQAEENPFVGVQRIVGDYFPTVGLQVLKGRTFGLQDETGPPSVTIINNNFARRFWADEDPIGKRIQLSVAEGAWLTIVGVVGDVKRRGLNEDLSLDAYLPYGQSQTGDMALLARTEGSPSSLFAPLRGQIRAMDPDLPLNVVHMKDVVDDSVSVQRVASMLFGMFGTFALLLATIGLYGVMAYSVSQRTHEIGVRMALGGTTRDVLTMVLKQSLKLVGAGVALGLVGAFALTILMSNLLFGVSATDPVILLGVTMLMIVIALLATYVPARRAANISPVIALKYE